MKKSYSNQLSLATTPILGQPTRVFLGLGSNVEREKNLRSALNSLERKFGVLSCSSIYESATVGFDGDPFYNMVLAFETQRALPEVVLILRKIEIEHGRTRASCKFSSRTLDLDLMLYGDLISEEEGSILPRGDILQYAFVLETLAEIAPELVHPVQKKTYSELWSKFDKTKVKQQRLRDHPLG